MHILDFGDKVDLPTWFRSVLRRWLAIFQLTPRRDMPEFLHEMLQRHDESLSFKPLYRSYVWCAEFKIPSKF